MTRRRSTQGQAERCERPEGPRGARRAGRAGRLGRGRLVTRPLATRPLSIGFVAGFVGRFVGRAAGLWAFGHSASVWSMTCVAVTGAAGLVGQHTLPGLTAAGATRIVGLDVREPRRRVPGLQAHRVDIASADLVPILEGVDVVVHLASIVDPMLDESLMTRANIGGTRRVLDAAAATGVTKLVRVSTAAVYGAWPNNPVPLTESEPLRPNPGFAPAVHDAEIERIVAEWADAHPDVTVTTLRAAPVVGPGADRLVSRLLLGRPRLRVRGAGPPVQVVHVDDLASALVLAVGKDLPGAYNVAADGWLADDAVTALLPRSAVPPVPGELLSRVLHRSWSTGSGSVPPGIVPYLSHPWVVATDRLRQAGWRASHTNEEAILEGLDALGPPASRAPLIAVGVTGGAVLAGAAIGWWARRRRR